MSFVADNTESEQKINNDETTEKDLEIPNQNGDVKDQYSDSKEANGRNKRAPRVVVIARGAVGTVEMYNRDRGYGFVKRVDTDEDIFFHRSDIISTRFRPDLNVYFLRCGDILEFDVVDGPRGHQAVSVSVDDGSLVPLYHFPLNYNSHRSAPVGQKQSDHNKKVTDDGDTKKAKETNDGNKKVSDDGRKNKKGNKNRRNKKASDDVGANKNGNGDGDKKEPEQGGSKSRKRADRNNARRNRPKDGQQQQKENDKTSDGEEGPKTEEDSDKAKTDSDFGKSY